MKKIKKNEQQKECTFLQQIGFGQKPMMKLVFKTIEDVMDSKKSQFKISWKRKKKVYKRFCFW